MNTYNREKIKINGPEVDSFSYLDGIVAIKDRYGEDIRSNFYDRSDQTKMGNKFFLRRWSRIWGMY
jgi:hypothetical protein